MLESSPALQTTPSFTLYVYLSVSHMIYAFHKSHNFIYHRIHVLLSPHRLISILLEIIDSHGTYQKHLMYDSRDKWWFYENT